MKERQFPRSFFVYWQLTLGVLGIICPVVSYADEGFGMTKANVFLERLRPADVFIPGTEIDVRASGEGEGSDVERRLVSSLESQLLGNDLRLSRAIDQPSTVIEVAILDSNGDSRWESRQVSRMVAAGKDSKGKTRYESRKVTVRYKIVSYFLSLSFQVQDMKSGRTLDADTVEYDFKKEYEDGKGALEKAQLEGLAIQDVSQRIAQRLTPTAERIGVLLPKKSFKDYINLAEAGLWNRYLEALERLPARPNRKDEAYRQYAMGVAYEALGYGVEDPETAIRYLEQATEQYNAAIEGNPAEKYFTGGFEGSGFFAGLKKGWAGGDGEAKQAMAPIERVRSALEQYQRVIEYREKNVILAQAGARALEADAGDDDRITNRSIIEMAAAGLSDDVILAALKHAEAMDFDTSPRGLIELAKGNVSERVIQYLQEIGSK